MRVVPDNSPLAEAIQQPTLHKPNSTDGPLAGIRVLDWTHVLAGPQAAFQMAALGAEVIRLENPLSDDIVRSKAADPALAEQGLGEGYCMLGAGRRTVSLNASSALGRDAVAALIASCDVVLENFRPGKLNALGFAPQKLIKQYPRLIVCSITGFPSDSAEADRPAYDHVVQAASGLMMANADEQGIPRRVGFPVVDYAIGMHAASAVVAALYRRLAQQASGVVRSQGEWLQLSMLETASMLLSPSYAAQAISGKTVPRSASTAYSGSALSGTFEAQQGYIALVCNNAAQSHRLFQALRAVQANEVAVTTLQVSAMAGNVSLAQSQLQNILRENDAKFWEEHLVAHDVPCAQLRQPYEAFLQTHRPLQVRVGVHAQARVAQLATTGYQSSEVLHGRLRDPKPRGWDTMAVLCELGWSEQKILDALGNLAAVQHPLNATGEYSDEKA
jgi:crotonobetainyl-CoA:carnitine CoA-transferase CaiB-like acyl-CoA transferase